ncbi:hypothetical protein Taro_021441 [Colocasia esculenta]|uniref:Uncharacterized protein n=1 Tax=Colocasia esculenta TaxID=4460 RepID=A0A843UZ04_COLES|nr:hypothetical protein [Colocasia esculenta]
MSEGTGGGSTGGGGGSAHPPPQEDQQNLIESFCGITSSTPAEAIFFLESNSWQLDTALQSFDGANDDDTARSLPPAVPAAASRLAAPASRRHQLQEDDEDYVPPVADKSPRQHPPTRSTVAAMASSSGTGSAWFEELRRQRVEELRRELEQSEDSIRFYDDEYEAHLRRFF